MMHDELLATMRALTDAINRKSGASLTLVPNDSPVTATCFVSVTDLRRLAAKCGVDVEAVLAPDNLSAYRIS